MGKGVADIIMQAATANVGQDVKQMLLRFFVVNINSLLQAFLYILLKEIFYAYPSGYKNKFLTYLVTMVLQIPYVTLRLP